MNIKETFEGITFWPSSCPACVDHERCLIIDRVLLAIVQQARHIIPRSWTSSILCRLWDDLQHNHCMYRQLHSSSS
jgi:hypothetical protein